MVDKRDINKHFVHNLKYVHSIYSNFNRDKIFVTILLGRVIENSNLFLKMFSLRVQTFALRNSIIWFITSHKRTRSIILRRNIIIYNLHPRFNLVQISFGEREREFYSKMLELVKDCDQKVEPQNAIIWLTMLGENSWSIVRPRFQPNSRVSNDWGLLGLHNHSSWR